MVKLVLLVCLSLLLSTSLPFLAYGDKPIYYGFFHSDLGEDYKKFKSDIFGFAIDMQNTWQYSVFTRENILHAVFVPPWSDFSKGYTESFEHLIVSYIPNARQASIKEIVSETTIGFKLAYKDYEVTNAQEIIIQDIKSHLFFESFTGPNRKVPVKGFVCLIPYRNVVYNVNFRADPKSFEKSVNEYMKWTKSFIPHPTELNKRGSV